MSLLVTKLQRIFALTPDEERVLKGACTEQRTFGAREDIIRKGDRPWKANLLVEGMVCRYRALGGGRRQILSFQYPGDVFGAYSFILELMDHSIATLMRSTIAWIPHENMLEITENYPRLTRAIWKDTLIDAAVFYEWTTTIRSKEPFAQIAHLICEMYVRQQVVGLVKDGAMPWPLIPEDIADALALAPDYVAETLRDFQHRGWIAPLNGRLLVHDLDHLKGVSAFEPSYLHLEPPRGAAAKSLPRDWIKPL